MTARAKRKKDTKFSTHQYTISKFTPTGEFVDALSVIGSRDAFHKQTEFQTEGFFVVVLNNTTDTEEFRSKGL